MQGVGRIELPDSRFAADSLFTLDHQAAHTLALLCLLCLAWPCLASPCPASPGPAPPGLLCRTKTILPRYADFAFYLSVANPSVRLVPVSRQLSQVRT